MYIQVYSKYKLDTFCVAVHPRSSVDCVSDEAVARELVSYDSSDDGAFVQGQFSETINQVSLKSFTCVGPSFKLNSSPWQIGPAELVHCWKTVELLNFMTVISVEENTFVPHLQSHVADLLCMPVAVAPGQT